MEFSDEVPVEDGDSCEEGCGGTELQDTKDLYKPIEDPLSVCLCYLMEVENFLRNF